MYDIDRCTILGVQLLFFHRLHARKWNNFHIALVVLVFVLNKNIGNLLPVCKISMPDCCVIWHWGFNSHDNYRKEIYIHVELRLQLQLFFKASEVSRSEFSRFEVSRSEFSRSDFSKSEVWGLKFQGLSFRETLNLLPLAQ